ncbi:hypothetical protein CYLTODRAFT_149008 [Cylindrobasidium torrendii FP15055 ss-10]|uniref:Uncharacterized protein n=1 Tax=Cylindrobasidium torrendii FP15055 ss-10 TaxID=1314674 RepID=A0A0D7BNC0_9AGAR|nr:hypothetical protein CYLTODRAFT_149008 [Cylindrobasidium torrendii FP15055 ss-10]
MIQFSKPRRTLSKAMDQFKRHETSARDYLGGGPSAGIIGDSRRSGTPSRFDSSFYGRHDPMAFIPSDAQSLRSQQTYSSGLPSYTSGMRGKSSYASSIASQDVGGSGMSVGAMSSIGEVPPSALSTGYMASERMSYAQSDRMSSAAESVYGDYKSVGDREYDGASDVDDVKSQYAGGVTVF